MRPTSGAWSSAVEPAVLDLHGFDRQAGVWSQSFDLDQARNLVRRYPGRSVWLEHARECVIVGDWRRRPEVAAIAGIHAVRYRPELMAAAADRAAELELEGIVVIEWTETISPAVYDAAGFDLLDSVVPFEIDRRNYPRTADPSSPIQRLDTGDASIFDQLMSLDHASFGWLWINGPAEFAHYGRASEVELWGQVIDGRLRSYLGITIYGHWGHIDRLAVHPDWQGRGLGEDLTRFGIARLSEHGCATVGLSTQTGNWRSQRLYSKLGFRRSDANTYRIYGRNFGNR